MCILAMQSQFNETNLFDPYRDICNVLCILRVFDDVWTHLECDLCTRECPLVRQYREHLIVLWD